MRLSRAVLFLVLLVAAAGVAWSFYPPFRLLALYAAGRNVVCPVSEAVQSASHVEKLRKTKDRILGASKLLESDPAGYQLWDTPKGRWWIALGSEYVLPFNLAE